MPSLYCKAWVMAVGEIPAIWRQHRYPLSLHYQLSVWGHQWGEAEERVAPVFSGRCSFLPGRNRILFGSVPPHCCLLVHITGWDYIIFLLEFFPFLPAVESGLYCREKGKDFLWLFLEHEMVDVSYERCSQESDEV